jgi:hypothetical protein
MPSGVRSQTLGIAIVLAALLAVLESASVMAGSHATRWHGEFAGQPQAGLKFDLVEDHDRLKAVDIRMSHLQLQCDDGDEEDFFQPRTTYKLSGQSHFHRVNFAFGNVDEWSILSVRGDLRGRSRAVGSVLVIDHLDRNGAAVDCSTGGPVKWTATRSG